MSKITRFRGDTEPLIINIKADGSPMDLTDTTVTLYYSDRSIVGVNGLDGQVSFTPIAEEDFQTVGQMKYKLVKKKGSTKTTLVMDILQLDNDKV